MFIPKAAKKLDEGLARFAQRFAVDESETGTGPSTQVPQTEPDSAGVGTPKVLFPPAETGAGGQQNAQPQAIMPQPEQGGAQQPEQPESRMQRKPDPVQQARMRAAQANMQGNGALKRNGKQAPASLNDVAWDTLAALESAKESKDVHALTTTVVDGIRRVISAAEAEGLTDLIDMLPSERLLDEIAQSQSDPRMRDRAIIRAQTEGFDALAAILSQSDSALAIQQLAEALSKSLESVAKAAEKKSLDELKEEFMEDGHFKGEPGTGERFRNCVAYFEAQGKTSEQAHGLCGNIARAKGMVGKSFDWTPTVDDVLDAALGKAVWPEDYAQTRPAATEYESREDCMNAELLSGKSVDEARAVCDELAKTSHWWDDDAEDDETEEEDIYKNLDPEAAAILKQDRVNRAREHGYTVRVPRDVIAKICPSCAEKMAANNWSHLKVRITKHDEELGRAFLRASTELRKAKRDYGFGPGPRGGGEWSKGHRGAEGREEEGGFFSYCMSEIAPKAKVENPEALCAALHYRYLGRWPAEDKALEKIDQKPTEAERNAIIAERIDRELEETAPYKDTVRQESATGLGKSLGLVSAAQGYLAALGKDGTSEGARKGWETRRAQGNGDVKVGTVDETDQTPGRGKWANHYVEHAGQRHFFESKHEADEVADYVREHGRFPEYALAKDAEFEAKHPRDERGRFTSTAGSGDGSDAGQSLSEALGHKPAEGAAAKLNLREKSLRELASIIRRDWGSKLSPYAAPYIDAMSSLDGIDDHYGADSGREIVAYALGNMASWKGDTARAVKAELKSRLKKNLDEALAKNLIGRSEHAAMEELLAKSDGNTGEINVSDTTYVGEKKVKCPACPGEMEYSEELNRYVCNVCDYVAGSEIEKTGTTEGTSIAVGPCPNCGQPLAKDAEFEAKHPRDERGRFTSTAGSGDGKVKENEAASRGQARQEEKTIYYLTYSNEGRPERTPFRQTLQEAIDTREWLKSQGAKRIRIVSTVATRHPNGHYYVRIGRKVMPVKIFDAQSNEMRPEKVLILRDDVAGSEIEKTGTTEGTSIAVGPCPNCGQPLAKDENGTRCVCGYTGAQEASMTKPAEDNIRKLIQDFVENTESFVAKYAPNMLAGRIARIVRSGGQT